MLHRTSVLAVLLMVGCYRTNTREPSTDATRADVRGDAGGREAGMPDARLLATDASGGRDAQRLDASSGGACETDRDCAPGGEVCGLDRGVAPVDLGNVPLVCRTAVGAGFVGGLCADGSACRNDLCALGGGCVVPCVADLDCTRDEHCVRIPVPRGDALEFMSGCTPWAVASPGTMVIRGSASPSGGRAIAIPGAASANQLDIFVPNRSLEPFAFIESLATTDGRLLFTLADFGRVPQPNIAVTVFQVASLRVPNGDAPHPRTGMLLTLSGAMASRYDTFQVTRTRPGNTLDLNLYFTAIRTARRDAFVTEMLSGYDAILRRFGLQLGAVRRVNIPGARRFEHELIDDDEEVPEILRLSAGAGRAVVNVFFAESSPDFYGISGGIPGAYPVHGTGNSGVLLCLGDIETLGPAGAAQVLAHELGHYQGFMHTSEADGGVFDPFADTPACDASRDSDGDGFLSPFECVGFGADNVMFWGGIDEAGSFSPRQQQLLQTSMVLQ